MFFAFFCLLMFNGAVGALAWLAWQRVSMHMRNNPEAAQLFSECVVMPLLTGNTDKPEANPLVKKTKGTLV
jgi:hypothetical protein